MIRYLETSQIIPAKGMSYTMYEIEGEDKILRMLTTIPDMDETHIYPKPPVKKLYKPDLCREVPKELFLEIWAKAEKK